MTLQLDAVVIRAGARTLIGGLTQTISTGEVWCIAGPNGAGKTTLINARRAACRSMAAHSRHGARRTSHARAR
jgi:iron complex transport system ATP-binding protein